MRERALLRPRLVLAVQGRWERRATVVVAGAGFGKSTLLAQAIEESALAPDRCDVSVRLEPSHASAARLATSLLAQLGADPPDVTTPDELAAVVADVVWARAPERVGIVLDDVHLLEPGSAGLELLRRLVSSLPADAHLLVGSRTLPDVGIARLAVENDALVLREEDLRFTDEEVEQFAALRHVDPATLRQAGGWPALMELLAGTSGVTAVDYVWEQVLDPLDISARARLVEVAALGGADDELATAVAGVPFDLATLLEDLPLTRRSDSGWWEVHEVVAAPLLARESRATLAVIRARGGVWARERGDLDRALRLFIAAGATDEVLATLRLAFVQLGAPEDPGLAAAWAAMLPGSVQDEPEALLVQCIGETTVSPERGYEVGQRAVAAFAARGDVTGEIAALARLGAIAYSLVNLELMLPHVDRVAELARTGHPWAVAFDAVCRGVLAGLVGRWREAEQILRPVASDQRSDPSQGLAAYFCARAQLEVGRINEAALTIERMPEAHRRRMRDGVLGMQVTIAQATGAADHVLEDLRRAAEQGLHRRPAVARRIAQAWLITTLSYTGDLAAAREARRELDRMGSPTGSSIDDELVAAAALAVAEGREDAAVDLLDRVPDRGVLFPPREASVLFYVLRPEVRAAYDERDLEGVFDQRRAFARLLVAGRAGDLEPARRFTWPRAEVVRWFAPPPWIAEAVVYTMASGTAPPPDVVQSRQLIPPESVRRLADSADERVAGAARELGGMVPTHPADPIVVRVLGNLDVEVGGKPSSAPELRRERVRSLLGLLVTRRSVRRLEVATELWPHLGEAQALANLRVTLSHLLRLLEPGRARNAASTFIRQDQEALTLVDREELSVDAWEFEALVAEAEDLDRAGAPSLALDAYRRAVRLWRGQLLAELETSEWLAFARTRLGAMFVRSAIRAGELLAAHADHAEAIAMAERAIRADPWADDAYRLLAGAHLARGDRAAARRVLEHYDVVLGELGLARDPATEHLWARVAGGG